MLLSSGQTTFLRRAYEGGSADKQGSSILGDNLDQSVEREPLESEDVGGLGKMTLFVFYSVLHSVLWASSFAAGYVEVRPWAVWCAAVPGASLGGGARGRHLPEQCWVGQGSVDGALIDSL